MSSSQVSGTLVTHEYKNFRGVDFSDRKDEVSLYRSPDALNMWKNYKNENGKCIETRPDVLLLTSLSNKIFGLFFYEINSVKHMIIHSGTKLYDRVNNVNREIYSTMNPHKSLYFVYNNILFIKDGLNYLEYNGQTCSEVVGYVPVTSISRSPLGGGKTFQDVNLLSEYRINQFCADGENVKYYMDVESFDSDFTPEVSINGIMTLDFVSYPLEGYIEFHSAPAAPLTDGQDNVIVKYKKSIEGHANRIKKSTLLEVFDNRVFFSGNIDYPNTIFHSSLDDPRYCSDTDYYTEGLDVTPIRTLIAGNNALWVIKEPSSANTSIFYHNPTIDSEFGKTYPSVHSSISTGCIGSGINFKDDIVFFSPNGMEGISSDVTTEQVIKHRSSLVDSKLLNETNYKDMQLIEWQGYLLVICENHIYLADSNAKWTNNDHVEYEWYYWEFDYNIDLAYEKDDVLYLCFNNQIYSLTADTDINSYWTTKEDEFGYPQYQKVTNKKGCVFDGIGENINVYVRTDKTDFALIKTFNNVERYIVSRIKKKKWKSIQIKIQSNKRFNLYSGILEAYVGSYIKR